MQSFFALFKTKQFYIHLGSILLLIFLVFFGVSKWLASYTSPGEFVTVPDFTGQELKNLETFVKDKEVTFQIIDSVYDPKEKAGIVLRQDPEAESKVKHNRTVYLYVTGMVPPQIIMPKLIDRSERQARLIIETYGLKVGSVTEKEADCNGCVLEQLVGGKRAEEGKPVKKGSVVSLIIGKKDAYFSNNKDTAGAKPENPDFDNDNE